MERLLYESCTCGTEVTEQLSSSNVAVMLSQYQYLELLTLSVESFKFGKFSMLALNPCSTECLEFG